MKQTIPLTVGVITIPDVATSPAGPDLGIYWGSCDQSSLRVSCGCALRDALTTDGQN
nr:uncharacterized protein LOC6636874 isoform X8 [Drosophila virilis]